MIRLAISRPLVFGWLQVLIGNTVINSYVRFFPKILRILCPVLTGFRLDRGSRDPFFFSSKLIQLVGLLRRLTSPTTDNN